MFHYYTLPSAIKPYDFIIKPEVAVSGFISF